MDKVLQLLGLAMRAGKVVSGEEMVIEQIRTGKAKLVFISTDIAKNSEKRIKDKCASYGIPLYEYKTRYDLGRAIGKGERVAIAVIDSGFARSFVKLLQ